jgi:hypothetical protein
MHVPACYARACRLCTCLQAMHVPAGYARACRLCTCLQAMLAGYARACRLCKCLQAMHVPTGYSRACRLCTCLQVIHVAAGYARACKLCTCRQVTCWVHAGSSQILSPGLGRKLTPAKGLSYRPARLHRLAGRYTNTLCRSQLYPPVRDYEFGYRNDQQKLLIVIECGRQEYIKWTQSIPTIKADSVEKHNILQPTVTNDQQSTCSTY